MLENKKAGENQPFLFGAQSATFLAETVRLSHQALTLRISPPHNFAPGEDLPSRRFGHGKHQPRRLVALVRPLADRVGKTGGQLRNTSTALPEFSVRSCAERDYRLKAAVNHARAIEGHRVGFGIHARIRFHQILHARESRVARRFVRPFDP